MPSVLAIAAHPDDIEFFMAGTLLRLKQVGYELHYLTIANGCCGSTEWSAKHTAEIRAREALEAADRLGAEFHPSLANDLEIAYDDRLLRRVASIVRKAAPEILLTHSPVDYMEDHEITCRLAVTAAFARGMPNFRTEPPREPLPGPVTVYHAQPHGNREPVGPVVRPTLFVDIADVLDEKTRLLDCHVSQRQWLDQSQGMSSMARTIHDQAREVGEMSGRFQYAEGWRCRLHLGFCDPDADPLAKALGEHAMAMAGP